MRIFILDILTDNKSQYQKDEKMLHSYGGYIGLIQRALGFRHKVESLMAGLCALEEIENIIAELIDFSGIIIPGSFTNIGLKNQIKPWQKKVFKLIRRAVKMNIPSIGFCGGHQYGARALTGDKASVIRNPRGRNFGTSPVKLTSAGTRHPLFKGCSNKSLFQWSHSYIVDKVPKNSIILACHSLSKYAAFQYKSFIGLQWHPELGASAESDYGVKIMRQMALERKTSLINEGFVKDEKNFKQFMQKDIKPAPDSIKIIKNWLGILKKAF